jgi:hypothetical protein
VCRVAGLAQHIGLHWKSVSIESETPTREFRQVNTSFWIALIESGCYSTLSSTSETVNKSEAVALPSGTEAFLLPAAQHSQPPALL